MESIDSKIKAILNGQIAEDDEKEFLNVDFTLEQHNADLIAKGQPIDGPNSFSPRLGTTITYIVAAVIFNEQNEVLMIQEAKSRCAGSWYIPAGRVEKNETLEDAIKREVLEESGFIFQPTTLLKVESSLATWYRFVYTGNIIGGKLKTVAQADQESIQAAYVSDLSKLTLRSKDCLNLIQFGREYIKHCRDWFSPQLVTLRAVPNIYLRLFITIFDAKSKVYILISNLLVPHLPLCEINPKRSVHATLKRFMQHIFGPDLLPQHRPHGLLMVENDGSHVLPDREDGLCLTLLVLCKDLLDKVSAVRTGFSWKQLDKELESLVLPKLTNKNKSINYTVL